MTLQRQINKRYTAPASLHVVAYNVRHSLHRRGLLAPAAKVNNIAAMLYAKHGEAVVSPTTRQGKVTIG